MTTPEPIETLVVVRTPAELRACADLIDTLEPTPPGADLRAGAARLRAVAALLESQGEAVIIRPETRVIYRVPGPANP